LIGHGLEEVILARGKDQQGRVTGWQKGACTVVTADWLGRRKTNSEHWKEKQKRRELDAASVLPLERGWPSMKRPDRNNLVKHVEERQCGQGSKNLPTTISGSKRGGLRWPKRGQIRFLSSLIWLGEGLPPFQCRLTWGAGASAISTGETL